MLCLDKALYGLRKAPRAWNNKLDSCLMSLGFSRSVSEHVIYALDERAAPFLVGVYVNDLIIIDNDELEIAWFKE